MDQLSRITRELARVEEGKVKAYADNDRVILLIQNAPAELRRLAAALEKINVTEIQALVAYKPHGGRPGEPALLALPSPASASSPAPGEPADGARPAAAATARRRSKVPKAEKKKG